MIKLEYFSSADFHTLMHWIPDKELLLQWAGTQFNYPLTEKKLEGYIKDANDFEKSSTFIYKAIDTDSGRTVGHISLTSINRSNRSARITRVLVNNSDRGKGIAEQMMKSLMRIGFEELHLHRMSLGVYDTNTAAIKCYKKCGFQVDGILREIQRHEDSYWNLMEMSILENEWAGAQSEESSNTNTTEHFGQQIPSSS